MLASRAFAAGARGASGNAALVGGDVPVWSTGDDAMIGVDDPRLMQAARQVVCQAAADAALQKVRRGLWLTAQVQ